MQTPLTIFCDGACLPTNPGGTATWAFIVHRGDVAVYQQYGVEMDGPGATNNVAEYAAIYHALTWASCTSDLHSHISLYSDSQLVIYQLTGQYRVTVPALQAWQHRCKALAAKVGHVDFLWTPRERNADADALTQRAYREHVAARRHKERTS